MIFYINRMYFYINSGDIPNLLDLRNKKRGNHESSKPKKKFIIDGIEHELPKYDGSEEIEVESIAYYSGFDEFRKNFDGKHPDQFLKMIDELTFFVMNFLK